MLTVFQVCFFLGIGLMILSLILGNLFEIIGIDGLDLDIDGGWSFFLPISPILWVLFLAVFGGVGWLILELFPALKIFIIIVLAFVAGFLVSFLMNLLVVQPLKRAQNTSTPDEEELVGVQATVTETILQGGFGEISYVVNGNSYTSPAKGINGEQFKVGQKVVICWINDHVFYVSSFEL